MSFRIRLQADDFLRASKILDKKNSGAMIVPSVVCLAFALELYLKNLHFLLTGTAPRGHHIYKLFEKLPELKKQEIYNYKSIIENPFMVRGNIHSVRHYNQEYSGYERFTDQMKEISTSFEKWRYSYESSVLNYDSFFALAFIEALISITDNITQPNQG